MSIYKGNSKIIAAYKGVTPLIRIYKGTDLVFSNKLPSAYQEVEYLRGTGTQYIDTDIYGTNDHGVEIVYARNSLAATDSARFFGTRNGSGGVGAFCFVTSNSGASDSPLFLASNGQSYAPAQASGVGVDTNFHIIKCNVDNDKRVYYDGTLRFSGGSTPYTANAKTSIFRTYNATDYGAPGSVDIKFVKIYNNGELIRNYVPCYRKSDNKPGMYEMITGTFLTNDGTGEFAVSPTANLYNMNDSSILTNLYWVSSSRKLAIIANYKRSVFISCKPNTTYSCSTFGLITTKRVGTVNNVAYGADAIDYVGDTTAETITIRTGATGKYLVFQFAVNSDVVEADGGTGTYSITNDILPCLQIEEGPATSYIPYVS